MPSRFSAAVVSIFFIFSRRYLDLSRNAPYIESTVDSESVEMLLSETLIASFRDNEKLRVDGRQSKSLVKGQATIGSVSSIVETP